MKVTYKMIDKQLRLRGYLIDTIMSQPSKRKFYKVLRRIEKSTETLKGKRAKGLFNAVGFARRDDGSELRLRIYQPLEGGQNLPAVLWLHGGGYAMGSPEVYEPRYRLLIEASPCVVIAPDYRKSLEEPYPAALEDAYTALLWVKNHAKALGIRDDQIFIGGESAGGGLVASLSLYARDHGEVKIAYQMPLYPMIDDRMITESARDSDPPVWNSKTNRWAWDFYLASLKGDQVSPYAAASRATNYYNLPPTTTYVGDVDIFRDETIQYVENLKQAGVPVHFKMLAGCYHGFDISNPVADVSLETHAFLAETFQYAVKHYFAKQGDSRICSK